MDGEPRRTGPEMPDGAGELDPELAELSGEQLEEIAGGDDRQLTRRRVTRKRCPKCKQSYLISYWYDGKPSFMSCPNCRFRREQRAAATTGPREKPLVSKHLGFIGVPSTAENAGARVAALPIMPQVKTRYFWRLQLYRKDGAT